MVPRTLQVLLIDDDEHFAGLVKGYLRSTRELAFAVTHLLTLGEGITELGEQPYDVVLLDLTLPDSDSPKTYGTFRQSSSKVPVIVLTSLDDMTLATSAMRQGAQDYLTKDSTNRAVLSKAILYAIERQKVMDQAQYLAALEERQRLARDLHDSVSQTLFSASVIAETVLHVYGDRSDQISQGLADLQRLTKGARAEMQTLLMELRPAALTDHPLDRSLGTLVQAMQSRTKITVRASLMPDCKLPPEVQIVFYRVAQEALNNVLKHSGATQATVNLTRDNGTIRLTIKDDGRGLPEQLPGGHGLTIMNERAQSVGGQLAISSSAVSGTTVELTWVVPTQM
jgi:signal transduction histidine kinase